MFNPDKDFGQLVIACLGKEGKSISALSKDLEAKGIKIHRLIITGYLRALADQGLIREKEYPPSKIYQPARSTQDTIYEIIGRSCRDISDDPDELILYVLNRMFKRPIFQSELRASGVMRPIGRPASDREIQESRRILKRAGNIVPSEKAVFPDKDYLEQYCQVLNNLVLDSKGCRYLVMETKQTMFI